MKTKLLIAALVLACVTFMSLNSSDPQPAENPEYAIALYYPTGLFVRSVGGKTESITLECQKVEGVVGKTCVEAAVKELNKLSSEGYEVVSTSEASYNSTSYLLRKIKK